MAAFSLAVDARCPLCGSPVLSVSRAGRVVAEDYHPIALGATSGYTLCDNCAVLSTLPSDLTLN